jgi:hypothetical protein
MAGVDRARQQLLLAATIKNLSYDSATGALSFEVQNNTAHKLISGFPEGRRMFVNIRAYDADGNVIYEVNPYDGDDPDEVEDGARTLKGLPASYSPNSPSLGTNEIYSDELVYEMHPTSSTDVPDAEGLGLTGEKETFHFALATGRYKDNRIPPKGFDLANADARKSLPVWHGVPERLDNLTIYTLDEYAGGYDDVSLTIAPDADYVEVNLYYQTTSREYIEFLRDEINGSVNLTLPTTPGVPGPGDPAHYIIQTDPFFGQLRAWGDTIWQLWDHNKDVPGAAPFLMTSGAWGSAPTGCTVGAPTLDSATAGHSEMTLAWTAGAGSPTGFKVYYDQGGKAQLVADAGNNTTHVDAGLTNGVEYCYKVTAYDETCESGYSSILCATPENQGQTTPPAGVDAMETGLWTGKGKNQTWHTSSDFAAGDTVTIRAQVLDRVTGLPVESATVEITIGGPETTSLNSNPSDGEGWAEATWNTQAPNKKGNGGTATGTYQATVTNVTATGYHWDGMTFNTTFTIP